LKKDKDNASPAAKCAAEEAFLPGSKGGRLGPSRLRRPQFGSVVENRVMGWGAVRVGGNRRRPRGRVLNE